MSVDTIFTDQGESNRKHTALRGLVLTSLYITTIAGLVYAGYLLSFYLHAKNILGFYPSHDNPDPKSLAIYDDYAPSINTAFEIWIYCFAAWILLVLLYAFMTRRDVNWKHILISFVGHLIAISVTLSELMTWFAD